MDQASVASEEYEIEWTKTAQRSLNQIVSYIAKDKPLAAENFRQEIIQHVRLLKKAPHLGRIVPEFGNPIRRELLHGNYRIIYRVHLQLKKIQITVIWHGKRLLPRTVYQW
jgi:plasmid stabilization system protein ParE